MDAAFRDSVGGLRPAPHRRPELPVREGAGLTGELAWTLFDAQATSRHLDLAARWLQKRGEGFHTVASAGHESVAAVGLTLRPTDPALLHYRSGAFYTARAGQVGHDPVPDLLLGFLAAADEPISGGRHKVLGHADLAVVPQTSTIGSHVPRAVGMAFALERAHRLAVPCPWPRDAVVVCGFGDASINHSTLVGAVNAASWAVYQQLGMPLLLVCEDNGLGISVPTPKGWVATVAGSLPGIDYLHADGTDPAGVYDAARQAVGVVRQQRRPVFLHLRTVRLMGHAGSDVESAYRSPGELAADLARDPLAATGRLLVESGVSTPRAVLSRYDRIGRQVHAQAAQLLGARRLASAEEVMSPIAPRNPARVARLVTTGTAHDVVEPVTFAQAVNRALLDAAADHPGLLVFGEDVARKGGVYGVTRGLQDRLGRARVFDTLLDEQTILGLALGAGLAGLLPVAEIQYLAYLHNAIDQLRGEAATLRFFSRGAFRNPMVVRVPGYGYQRGFGGHFHNDNAVASLRDIPGLVVASPARPDEAAAMLRTCLAAAAADGEVCVFIEPIALYHTRDLYADGDGRWLTPYPPAHDHVPIGAGRCHGDGADLTVVTFGNGLPMSLRVARRLASVGIAARVFDLRWLAPLPVAQLLHHAQETGRVLVVDETRRTGGVSEAVLTALVDAGFGGAVARVASADSFVPLGPAAHTVLLGEGEIERAAVELAGRPAGDRRQAGAG